MTERDMWLLSEVSSMGRTTIDVAQYEELRALAKRLVARIDALEMDQADRQSAYQAGRDSMAADVRRLLGARGLER